MQAKQSDASPSDNPPSKAPVGQTRETSNIAWAESDDNQLLQLVRDLPIEEIQKSYFPAFSAAQLKEITAQAQIRLRNRMINAQVFQPGGAAGNNDDADAEDQVIDTGFALRRAGRPAWEGTTSKWESKSKPGIGWLPEDERPDMEEFLRMHGKPLGK
jgi:hypothetical protein